jgi:hypothetical protein
MPSDRGVRKLMLLSALILSALGVGPVTVGIQFFPQAKVAIVAGDVIVVLLLLMLAYKLYTLPDERSLTKRLMG